MILSIDQTPLQDKSYKTRASIVFINVDGVRKYCVQIQHSTGRYFFAIRKKDEPRRLFHVEHVCPANLSKIARFKSIEGAKKAFSKEFPCKHINATNPIELKQIVYTIGKVGTIRYGKRSKRPRYTFDVNAWLYNR